MSLCPECLHIEHKGMTCMDCGCFNLERNNVNKEYKIKNVDMAIESVLHYIEKDTTDDNFQEAVEFLKEYKDLGKKPSDKVYDTIKIDKYSVVVRQTHTYTYRVLHESSQAAIEEVQEKIKSRDWTELLQYPPGNSFHKPIPPLNYTIETLSVKEDILRPNPEVQGTHKSDT